MQVVIDIPDELVPPTTGDNFSWGDSIVEYVAKAKTNEILLDLERTIRALQKEGTILITADNDSVTRLALVDQRLREILGQINLLSDFISNHLVVR